MMVWRGDYSEVYTGFSGVTGWWGEQVQIENALLKGYGVRPSFIQDMLPVVSYKRHCVPNGGEPPVGTRVVCFHGVPRPQDVINKHEWIKENWR
jgi:hypothetical protein